MKTVGTDRLNQFWREGILPIIESLAKKLGLSQLANNMLTTEEGFAMDARQGPVIQGQIDEVRGDVDEINGKLSNTVKLNATQTISGASLGSFTVKENGIILAQLVASNNDALHITINGLLRFRVYSNGTEISATNSYHVNKGDIVSLIGTPEEHSYVYFYPYK